MMRVAIVGVLLAAGQSRRFGSNKLLHRLDDGVPMAVAAARHLRALLPEAVAVVDDTGGEVATLLRQEGLRLVANPRAAEGMGTSIACGVAASADAAGWVIALGDMPYVPESVIGAVVSGLQAGSEIIAPVYRGQRGHPVGFSARHAQALMELRGDEGARGIIAAHQDSLDLVDVVEPGVLVDIDR